LLRTYCLTESQATEIDVSDDVGRRLAQLGRRLAATTRSGDDDDATVIRCRPSLNGAWSVTVREAIGIVQVGDVRLLCEPKIPMPHLLHLFRRQMGVFKADSSIARTSTADELWSLVAGWFVKSLEELIRSGLAMDYAPVTGDLSVVRGRLDPRVSAGNLLRGSTAMTCHFEEYSANAPLNRVLKASALAVARSGLLDREVRRRAFRAASHMDGVQDLEPLDLHAAQVERHTGRYQQPIELARIVLDGTGVGLGASASLIGHSFLLRTPELVESAIRSLVAETLADLVAVRKGRLVLNGAAESLNPDLVFGTQAVGDVKYKLWKGSWHRPDLYQIVTFATGYQVNHALKVGFAEHPEPVEPLEVGAVRLRLCDWQADPTVAPQDAEDDFVDRIRKWWSEVAC